MADEVSLKEFFEVRILALEKATTLAANNMEKRLESMNEFRSQLKDQAATFMSRAEFDSVIQMLKADINLLKESKALLQGAASQKSVTVSFIFSVIATFFGLVGLLLSLLK
jgi:predicted Zn-dependent peptidase